MDDLSGQVLDARYSLLRLLGEGALGQVYEASHVVTGRQVTVKLLRPELVTNPEALGRFYREARAAAAIGNKHICDVLDMRPPEMGPPYLVTEYLQGETLEERLGRQGRLEVGEAISIVLQVLEGLEAAHAVGIVHRNVKPENVVILEGDGKRQLVKIVDFGISKFGGRGEDLPTLTRPGALLGTPHYMSQEQLRGEGSIGPVADIYAVGVVLYRALSGKLPYEGATFATLIGRIIQGSASRVTAFRPELPEDLAEVVTKAFARNPEDRFQSAREMADALRAATAATSLSMPPADTPADPAESEGRPTIPTAAPSSEPGEAVRQRRRARSLLALGIVGVGLFAGTVSAGALILWTATQGGGATSVPGPSDAALVSPDGSSAPRPADAGTWAGPRDTGQPAYPRHRVVLVAVPREATLVLDGAALGSNPAEVELPADGARHVVRASATGYLEATREFSVTGGTEVTLELAPAGGAPGDKRGTLGSKRGPGPGSKRRGSEPPESNLIDPWERR